MLANDFFVDLLDMGTAWKAISEKQNVIKGRDRKSGEVKWTGTRVMLAESLIGQPEDVAPERRSVLCIRRRNRWGS